MFVVICSVILGFRVWFAILYLSMCAFILLYLSAFFVSTNTSLYAILLLLLPR